MSCKGCEIAMRDPVRSDEVVHDEGCMFYKPEVLPWISIKSRLPENGQPVLIAEYDPHYSSKAISGEYFIDAGFVYVDAREGMRRGRDVRYWMPLPKVPKE